MGASFHAYSSICHRLRMGMPYSVYWTEDIDAGIKLKVSARLLLLLIDYRTSIPSIGVRFRFAQLRRTSSCPNPQNCRLSDKRSYDRFGNFLREGGLPLSLC